MDTCIWEAKNKMLTSVHYIQYIYQLCTLHLSPQNCPWNQVYSYKAWIKCDLLLWECEWVNFFLHSYLTTVILSSQTLFDIYKMRYHLILQGKSWAGRARGPDGRLDHHSTGISKWGNQTQNNGLLSVARAITTLISRPGEGVCRAGEHLSVVRQGEQKVSPH